MNGAGIPRAPSGFSGRCRRSMLTSAKSSRTPNLIVLDQIIGSRPTLRIRSTRIIAETATFGARLVASRQPQRRGGRRPFSRPRPGELATPGARIRQVNFQNRVHQFPAPNVQTWPSSGNWRPWQSANNHDTAYVRTCRGLEPCPRDRSCQSAPAEGRPGPDQPLVDCLLNLWSLCQSRPIRTS